MLRSCFILQLAFKIRQFIEFRQTKMQSELILKEIFPDLQKDTVHLKKNTWKKLDHQFSNSKHGMIKSFVDF